MKTPRILSSRISAVAAVVTSITASTGLQAANMTAQWNFDDVGNVGGSVSNVGGFVGTFNNVADRSASGGGVSGAPGDYSLDLRALDAFSPTGAMTSSTPEFLTALDATTGTQAISLTYWQFLNATPNSTSFWGNSPSSNGSRGLNAHSPWSDGNSYFDTSGCCSNPSQRTSGFLGATTGVWELVAFTFDNGTRSIYRRDLAGTTTLIAQDTGGLPLPADFDAFYVGNDNTVNNSGMDARLDNFTIWTGALTEKEISALPVPEPGTAMLCGAGAMLGLLRRRRRCS